jgi:hypothetical protein
MRAMFTAMASVALTDTARSDVRREGSPRREAARATRRRRITAGLLAGGVAMLLLVHSTTALGMTPSKRSVFAPAPAYPNSTLAIDLVGHPRAGKVVRVVVSGSNDPFEIGGQGSGEYLAYQLDAFAQNGRVLPNCPRSFAEELQNQVNLGISRIAQGLPAGYYGRFSTTLSFQTSRRVRDIVVCAYTRMITDDAAVSALRFRLRRP